MSDPHATHTSDPHAEPEETTEQVESAPMWTWGLLSLACLLILVITWVSSCNQKRLEAAQKANTPATASVVVQKVGMMPTLYKFSDYPDGIVTHNFTGYQARWYPIGGCMEVTRPDKSKYIECPGDDPPLSEQRGIWGFKGLKNATGVYIWE